MNIEKEIEKLSKAGKGRTVIARTLGISESKATRVLKKLRDAEILSRSKMPVNGGVTDQFEDRLQKALPYIEKGYGCTRLAQALDITESSASRIIKRLKDQNPDLKISKDSSEDILEGFHDFSAYAQAKYLGKSLQATKTYVAKESGEHSPIEKDFKKFASKAFTLNNAKQLFGFKTEKQLKAAIDENFSNIIINEKTLPNKDKQYIIIPDKTGSFDWLNANKKEKQFKYYVSPENDYMYIEFAESVPNEIKLFNFTDTHVGSKFCMTDRLKEHVEMVRKDPKAFAVLGGDIFEYANKMSVGQPWDQDISPMEQVSETTRIFMPIAHKTLRYQGGNHDRGRGFKLVGADLAEVASTYLKVPYGVAETTIDINLKGQLFTILLHHGSGNGGSIQAILTEAEKYRKHCSYFVHGHFSGHVHQSFIMPRQATVKELGLGLATRRYFTVIGGSYLKYTGSYAQEAKFMPTPQDLTYMVFRADGTYDAGNIPIDSE